MKTHELQQTPSGGSDHRLVLLPVGEIIQRGDKFLSDDGRYLEMDNLGRLLGVRCLGQTLKKEGAWFREPNSSKGGSEMTPTPQLNNLVPIVMASDLPECECCEEPWCPTHEQHYSDCECVGPDNAEEQGLELREIGGKLYGVHITSTDHD